MIDFNSFYTFSGLFATGALVALMYRRFTLSGLLLTIAGAAGIGIFWERWSRLAGDDVHVTALFNPVMPTTAQWELLATHVPFLVCGVALIFMTARNRSYERSER